MTSRARRDGGAPAVLRLLRHAGAPAALRLLLASALLCWLGALELRAADPITYERRTVAGVSLHVIDVDLNDPRIVVSPAVAARGIGRTETFPHFMGRLSPAAAVNGTYFSKTTFHPIGDILIDGELAHFGGMGTALAFAPDGVDCIRLPKSRHVDWSEYRAALGAGPSLVWNGFAKPMPGGEGFGDPSVFARAAPRSAAGITADNHLLLVTTARGTSLGKLAAAMVDLGAVYAVNLDGGASAAMWYRGRMIHSPGSPLTNVLCVYLKPEPVARPDLRPPRGLDWRGGHPPRTTFAFAAGELSVTVKLPRSWHGVEPLLVEADSPLPEGWAVSLRLDAGPAGLSAALPAEFPLDPAALAGRNPKHSLWVGVLNDAGKAVGSVQRILHLPRSIW